MTTIDTSDVATLRRHNASAALALLRGAPERWFTVRELADATDLSRPTVTRVLEGLEDAGLADSQAGEPSGAGRPARRFRFAADAGVVLSLAADGARIAVRVADLAGKTLADHAECGTAPATEAELLDALGRAADAALASAGRTAPVRGVSVALPGAIDAHGVLTEPEYHPEWAGFALRPGLEARYPRAAVVLDRDLALCTLAELASGALRGVDSAVHLSFSDRSGATLVMGGELVRGAHGLAAARSRPAARTTDWPALRAELYGDRPGARLADIVEAARAGSGEALVLLRRQAEIMGPRLTFVMRAFAPQLLLVSGPVVKLPDSVLPTLRSVVATAMDGAGNDPTVSMPEIRLAEYPSEEAALLGGVHAALGAIDWIP